MIIEQKFKIKQQVLVMGACNPSFIGIIDQYDPINGTYFIHEVGSNSGRWFFSDYLSETGNTVVEEQKQMKYYCVRIANAYSSNDTPEKVLAGLAAYNNHVRNPMVVMGEEALSGYVSDYVGDGNPLTSLYVWELIPKKIRLSKIEVTIKD